MSGTCSNCLSCDGERDQSKAVPILKTNSIQSRMTRKVGDYICFMHVLQIIHANTPLSNVQPQRQPELRVDVALQNSTYKAEVIKWFSSIQEFAFQIQRKGHDKVYIKHKKGDHITTKAIQELISPVAAGELGRYALHSCARLARAAWLPGSMLKGSYGWTVLHSRLLTRDHSAHQTSNNTKQGCAYLVPCSTTRRSATLLIGRSSREEDTVSQPTRR